MKLLQTIGIKYYDTKLFHIIDLPLGSDPQIYYCPDLRKVALSD